jgi:signal transduction histidine kinase
VELNEVIRELADSFRLMMEERSLSLTVVPVPLPLVLGDEARLRQAMAVLLDNAMEYTLAGGEIFITAAHHGRDVQISVSDTGPGIPDAHKAHIFDRFYRADASRSRSKAHYGLGLSIAYEIMMQHGGKIEVTDRTGGGTVFTLYLKACD